MYAFKQKHRHAPTHLKVLLRQNKSLSRQNLEASTSANSTAINYSQNMKLQIKAGVRNGVRLPFWAER